MPDFPLIEMGEQYQETEGKRPGRVLATDGKAQGFPVLWERASGSVNYLTRDGKLFTNDSAPFIERVPKKITLKVNVFRQRGGLYVRGESELLDWGGKIATLDIEFVEGQGL